MNGQSSELFYLSSLNYYFPFLSTCGNGFCPNIAYSDWKKMKYEFGKSLFQTCFLQQVSRLINPLGLGWINTHTSRSVKTSVGQLSLILENCWFWFFKAMCENHLGFFFIKKIGGLQESPRVSTSTIATSWSQPMKRDTKWKSLNLGFNIRANILGVFLSSYFFKKERKLSKTLQTTFLMLEVKQINSSAKAKSSFIRVSRNGAFFYSFLIFKILKMAKWRASLNNQCPLYWFKTQVVTIEEK